MFEQGSPVRHGSVTRHLVSTLRSAFGYSLFFRQAAAGLPPISEQLAIAPPMVVIINATNRQFNSAPQSTSNANARYAPVPRQSQSSNQGSDRRADRQDVQNEWSNSGKRPTRASNLIENNGYLAENESTLAPASAPENVQPSVKHFPPNRKIGETLVLYGFHAENKPNSSTCFTIITALRPRNTVRMVVTELSRPEQPQSYISIRIL